MLVSGVANAACIGSNTFSTCNDSAGNSYTVNRFGNTTMMNGYNARTGGNWNESINHFGNMTSYQGTTNGRPWNMNQFDYGGGMRSYSGMNAAGQPFSYTCGPYSGCN